MSTTTLTAFWTGFASTVVETIFGNSEFFGMVFIVAVVIMLLGGLITALTMLFRQRKR